MLIIILLGLFLFLLSADTLFISTGEGKLKIAYLLLPFFWLKRPSKMTQAAKQLISKVPRAYLLGIIPLLISILLSHNRKHSLVWTGWLGFNLFTLITIYSFLKVQKISEKSILNSTYLGLGLISLFGVFQYVSIYFFKILLFSPQFHIGTYRINGASGWPHFLNIFSFLLLPIALTEPKKKTWQLLVLGCLTFILFQSTSKTGWFLFIGMSIAFAVKMRSVFFKSILGFMLPLILVLFLIPSPSLNSGESNSNSEKLSHFAQDLNPNQKTSGKDRLIINQMGLKVFTKHPLFGIGPRAYSDFVSSSFDQELPGENKYDVMDQINTRNENIWIELLAENGAIFTLFIMLILFKLLSTTGAKFSTPLQLGAWCSLVLYYVISGQFSQNILVTMTFAIWGIFFYSQDLNKTS